MKKHTFRLILATAITTVSMSATVYAAGWQHNDTGWWWQYDNGSWPSNSWQWLDGNNDGIAECYYFNGDGYMLSNTKTPDNYDVNGDGAWIVNGTVQTQQQSQGQEQSQNQGQVPQNSWNKENNSWRYYINSKAVTGWRKIDGKRYYFDSNGIMLTGFHDIDDNLYYFNASGDLQTKSFNRNGVHYEVNSDGIIISEQDEDEWRYINGTNKTSQSSNNSNSSTSNTTSNQSSSEDTSNYARKVLDLVNEERRKAGKSSLSWDDSLAACAAVRAEELTQLFSHTRPDGSDCFSIFSDYGVPNGYNGENIAAGQTTPAQVMNSWMNSTGHRENILNSNYNKLGVGFYQGNGTYRYYWVQMFSD